MIASRDELGKVERSVVTADVIGAVAAELRAHTTRTMLAACIEAGHARAHNSLKQGIWRVRHDKASDDEVELLAPILSALAYQASELVRMGGEAAADDKKTSWYEFLLERSHRYEYGRNQQVEVTGKDGEQLGASVDDMRTLLDVYIKASKDAKEGRGE